MRRVVRFAVDEAVPDEATLLRNRGLPSGSRLPRRVRDTLEEARDRYRRLVEPRGVFEEITIRDFTDVYQGEGRNAPQGVVAAILPRADGLALFAATLGERVTGEVAELFRAGEPALGYMLDAIASEGADALAYRLAAAFLAACRARGVCSWNGRALPYSPGYCGWDLSGQARLFDRLTPEEIGIDLTPRFLMRPLKSVSGVLVAGPREIHRVQADYPFCDHCETRPCRERAAAMLGGCG